MNLYEETQMLLNQYGLKANKKLGQNFMINQDVIDDIIEKSEITKDDVVIEIGPGLGNLTKALLENSKKVIAIELDRNMIDVLRNRFEGNNNIEIIYGDVLKIDLNEIINKYDKIKVVANLPYYITTPIIMKLLEDKLKIESITVMVQKEVGLRLCAKPNSKEYGAITVSVNFYSKPEIVIDVPKNNFMPMPEVDSCVIKLDVLEKPSVFVEDESKFFSLIKLGFNQRRKVITNSLVGENSDRDKIIKILKELNINEKNRAENLSIEDFANISNML